MNSLSGKAVQIAPARPRMQCSPEFARIQDPDLVAKTNAWMADFFGYWETVPDGQVLILNDGAVLLMNQKTWDRVRRAATAGETK